MADVAEAPKHDRKDFVSDQEVRWCPGCGDYAILAQMQRVLPELGIPREKLVFVSGIGCSSRFPYYMNTYGLHTIHGRATTVATGLKVANPDLHVWVITGDGDALSIGGNHLLHILRRNVNVNILLFNNRIYGLTKGQYSPTSPPGKVTKSSPMGSVEQDLNAISVALASEATFVARTVDRHTKHLAEILTRAAEHRGTSFVEIYQNCNIFNDGTWNFATENDVKDDNTLILEHGKPMIFGKEKDKGIRLKGLAAEVVTLGDGISEDDLLKHDETLDNPAHAYLLSRLMYPDYPVPLGVFRNVQRPIYEEQVIAQHEKAVKDRGIGDLHALLHSGDTWIVPEGPDGETVREMAEDEPSLSDIIPDISQEDPLAPRTPLQHLMYDPISSLNLPEPHCVPANTSLADAIEVMRKENAGCLLVTGGKKRLLGIFAQGDLFGKVAGSDIDLKTTTVADLMTKDPTTLKASDPIGHILHMMSMHGYRHIPIVDPDGRPISLASFKVILGFVGGLFSDGSADN
jgi:2-oxoglutarate/2-oxoacid ferredoxin oxidoreductase subunit beta